MVCFLEFFYEIFFTAIFLCLCNLLSAAQVSLVCNFGAGRVDVLDTNTLTILNSFAVGPQPREITVTPDGSRAYFTSQGSATVHVIDLINGVTLTPISIPGTTLTGITSNDTHVFAVDNSSPGSVEVIEIATNTVIFSIPVGGTPTNVEITHDGTQAWVPNGAGGFNLVHIIDIVNLSPTGFFNAPTGGTLPNGLAFTSQNCYVANQSSNDISIMSISSPLTPPTLVPSPTAQPQSIATTPDGTTAYVTTLGGAQLEVFDIASSSFVAPTPLPSPASFGLVKVTPDGRRVFVTHFGNNSVSRIDLPSLVVTDSGPLFNQPFGKAFVCTDEVLESSRKNIFLMQIDLLNVITWNPIFTTVAVTYEIYRDGALIGAVSVAGPFEFKDFNRKRDVEVEYSVYARTSNNFSLVGMVSVTAGE